MSKNAASKTSVMTASWAVRTNRTKGSLVKAIVIDDFGKWKSPNAQQVFYIDEDAKFPDIVFEIETEQPGQYQWSWSISWEAKTSGLRESTDRGGALKTFKESGSFTSQQKKWIADLNKKMVGGLLTVEVVAGKDKFKRSVSIRGKNPGEQKVMDFLSTMQDVTGFEKIIKQESQFKNFINADNQPVVAFDGGYGMTQLTNPAPTYEEAWSWKENIKGGSGLYQEKQRLAKSYLSKDKRTYTDEQLKLETWSRWNGGSYHLWDEASKQWKRNDDLVCDSATGNIGWDMTLEGNKKKTEEELRKRDKETYGNPKKNKKEENKWKYTGVCYADHLNEE